MSQISKILCCLCGTSIDPNAAAMCIQCLRGECDITGEIETSLEVTQCRKCEKWLHKLDQWISLEMESQHLLNWCLKRVGGLQKGDTRVVHAAWIWTEPHSKRLKLSADIEREVMDEKIRLRQRVIVDFKIVNRQCVDCTRDATEHTWTALVQVRQHAGDKRTLSHLESLLSKSGLAELMIDMEIKRDGLDLYFRTKNNAEKVAEFISSRMPSKMKSSKKLVSQDKHSHTSRTEHTIFIEIAPFSKDDLVILPREVSGHVELAIVTKVSSSLHFINPLTMSRSEVTASRYFSLLFTTALTSKQLTPFIVLDINPIKQQSKHHTNIEASKLDNEEDDNEGDEVEHEHEKKESESFEILSEAEVARVSDFGENDTTDHVITHLGHILQPGDTVLGYDLSHIVLGDQHEELLQSLRAGRPDVILVKKTFQTEITEA